MIWERYRSIEALPRLPNCVLSDIRMRTLETVIQPNKHSSASHSAQFIQFGTVLVRVLSNVLMPSRCTESHSNSSVDGDVSRPVSSQRGPKLTASCCTEQESQFNGTVRYGRRMDEGERECSARDVRLLPLFRRHAHTRRLWKHLFEPATSLTLLCIIQCCTVVCFPHWSIFFIWFFCTSLRFIRALSQSIAAQCTLFTRFFMFLFSMSSYSFQCLSLSLKCTRTSLSFVHDYYIIDKFRLWAWIELVRTDILRKGLKCAGRDASAPQEEKFWNYLTQRSQILCQRAAHRYWRK